MIVLFPNLEMECKDEVKIIKEFHVVRKCFPSDKGSTSSSSSTTSMFSYTSPSTPSNEGRREDDVETLELSARYLPQF